MVVPDGTTVPMVVPRRDICSTSDAINWWCNCNSLYEYPGHVGGRYIVCCKPVCGSNGDY